MDNRKLCPWKKNSVDMVFFSLICKEIILAEEAALCFSTKLAVSESPHPFVAG